MSSRSNESGAEDATKKNQEADSSSLCFSGSLSYALKTSHSNDDDDYSIAIEERQHYLLTQFQHQSHGLSLQASNVAALAGLHPYRNLPELAVSLVYQGKYGRLLQQRDASLLGFPELISPQAQLRNIAKKTESIALKQALEEALQVQNQVKKLHTTQAAQALQQKIADEAKKLPAAKRLNPQEMALLRDGARHAVNTGFGISHESAALDWYEAQCGWEVRERNAEVRTWTFVKDDDDDDHGDNDNDGSDMKDSRTKRNPNRPPSVRLLRKFPLSSSSSSPVKSSVNSTAAAFENDAAAAGGSSSCSSPSSSLAPACKRPRRGDMDRNSTSNSRKPFFFSLSGSVDGVRDELAPNNKHRNNDGSSNHHHGMDAKDDGDDNDDAESWVLRRVVVECKHRMNRLFTKIPIYEQVQTAVYCLLFDAQVADLVQVLRKRRKDCHVENKKSKKSNSKQNDTAAQKHPPPTSSSSPERNHNKMELTSSPTQEKLLEKSCSNNDNNDDDESHQLQPPSLPELQPTEACHNDVMTLTPPTSTSTPPSSLNSSSQRKAIATLGNFLSNNDGRLRHINHDNDHTSSKVNVTLFASRTPIGPSSPPVAPTAPSPPQSSLQPPLSKNDSNCSLIDTVASAGCAKLDHCNSHHPNETTAEEVDGFAVSTTAEAALTSTNEAYRATSPPRPPPPPPPPPPPSPSGENHGIDIDENENENEKEIDDDLNIVLSPKSAGRKVGEIMVMPDFDLPNPEATYGPETPPHEVLPSGSSSVVVMEEDTLVNTTTDAPLLVIPVEEMEENDQDVNKKPKAKENGERKVLAENHAVEQEVLTRNSNDIEEGDARKERDRAQQSSSSSPPQEHNEMVMSVSRIELDDPVLRHRDHWNETILPRLRSFVEAVYSIRRDDAKRYRLLQGVLLSSSCDGAKAQLLDAWQLLHEECPWLLGCETAFRSHQAEAEQQEQQQPNQSGHPNCLV